VNIDDRLFLSASFCFLLSSRPEQTTTIDTNQYLPIELHSTCSACSLLDIHSTDIDRTEITISRCLSDAFVLFFCVDTCPSLIFHDIDPLTVVVVNDSNTEATCATHSASSGDRSSKRSCSSLERSTNARIRTGDNRKRLSSVIDAMTHRDR
jgi:hypothetical protein